MNILAFGASSSKTSINQTLADHVASLISKKYILIDLNDYEMPLYSIDREQHMGIPEQAHAFLKQIHAADLIIISLSEHNGAYTAAFKNVFDWTSRVELKLFENKKMILLSTSPGGHGGQTVLDMALQRFPRHGAEIIGHLALPFFKTNFDLEKGIIDDSYRAKLNDILRLIQTTSHPS